MVFNIQNVSINNMNGSSSFNMGNGIYNVPISNQNIFTNSNTLQTGGAGSFTSGTNNKLNNPFNANEGAPNPDQQ